MAFIRTVPVDQADGKLLELYQDDLKTKGYVANHTSTFSLRPEVYEAWKNLLTSIRSKMRLRRFELVTFAAAQALGCTYCRLRIRSEDVIQGGVGARLFALGEGAKKE